MKTIADYDKEIQQNPNNAEAYNDRGATHRNNGNYDEAVADLTRSIQINPNNAQPYYNRGLAYMNIGENEKALNDYNKVIELAPEFSEAYFRRGGMNSMLGNIQESISDYEKFLELDPNNKNAKLVRDELKRLKSGKGPSIGDSDEDCFEVSQAKKDIKRINICSIVFGIIGLVFVIIAIIASSSRGSSGLSSDDLVVCFATVWIGIGLGGGFFSLFEGFGLFPYISKRDGFNEACKIALGGGVFFFVLFTILGPLGWLIKVVKRKNTIKKFQNQ